MSQIDSELDALRQKLALLEEQKKQEQLEEEAKKSFYTKNYNPILISLPIYSSEDLLQLKAKKDEEERIKRITEFITNIHKCVIKKAETSSETKYAQIIPRLRNQNMCGYDMNTYYNQPIDEFYITNKIEIICNLQYLFPRCEIKHVIFEKIVDQGQIYNIDNLPQHLAYLKNNKQSLDQNTKKIDYLIIDWT
jgi:hypothetical protein